MSPAAKRAIRTGIQTPPATAIANTNSLAEALPLLAATAPTAATTAARFARLMALPAVEAFLDRLGQGGALALLVQRIDQTDAEIKRHYAHLDALNGARCPLPSLAAPVGVTSLSLSVRQFEPDRPAPASLWRRCGGPHGRCLRTQFSDAVLSNHERQLR